ncbi:tyrosine-type recombinase/integrase [Bradyrhizobium sp. 1.27L]
MQWAELDTNSGLWRLPGARTKNDRQHLLPLVPAALALLPPRRKGRDFLFGEGPRRSGDPHRGFSGWSKSKTALDARISEALGEPLPHWTVHDLRRSAATAMADRLGVLPHIVEAILNHVSGHRAGVAGVYNRARYAAEMREALERWAEHVATLPAQKPGGADIVIASAILSSGTSHGAVGFIPSSRLARKRSVVRVGRALPHDAWATGTASRFYDHIALTMFSVTFLASPSSIMVLSR